MSEGAKVCEHRHAGTNIYIVSQKSKRYVYAVFYSNYSISSTDDQSAGVPCMLCRTFQPGDLNLVSSDGLQGVKVKYSLYFYILIMCIFLGRGYIASKESVTKKIFSKESVTLKKYFQRTP